MRNSRIYGNLARQHGVARDEAEVYETWAGINRAFEQTVSALNKLQKMRRDNG
jgi:hypothetical protein